jgi:hypothetical protein
MPTRKKDLKFHLRSARHPDRTCCGWDVASRRGFVVRMLEKVEPAKRCKMCDKKRRFAAPLATAYEMGIDL